MTFASSSLADSAVSNRDVRRAATCQRLPDLLPLAPQDQLAPLRWNERRTVLPSMAITSAAAPVNDATQDTKHF